MPDGPCAGPPDCRRGYRDWRRLSGVGCFGKPDTLITMLENIMAQYERDIGQAEDCIVHGSAVACAVRHLMQRLSEERRAFDDRPPAEAIQTERVTGFFIHSDCGCIRIRVFTRKSMSPF